MILKEPFYYIDSKEKQWLVPAGTVVNGATIPFPLWSVIGSPYIGDYRQASVVHDYFVEWKDEGMRYLMPILNLHRSCIGAN